MEMYLFRPTDYQRLYDCSNFTSDEWTAKGNHEILHIVIPSAIIGALCLVCYLPCLWAIRSSSLWKIPCYKLMFCLGLYDLFLISVGIILSAYWNTQGYVFCSNPDVFYIFGCLVIGTWNGQIMVCLAVAINRFSEFWKIHKLQELYKGRRIYFWLLPSAAWFIFFSCFTPPPVVTSYGILWYYDPYLDLGVGENPDLYVNWYNATNNFILLPIMITLYVALLVMVRIRYKTVNKTHLLITIQAVTVCFICMLTTLLHAIMQLIPVPFSMIVICLYCFVLSCGAPSIVYLTINKTIRRKVFGILFPKQFQIKSVTNVHVLRPNTVHSS